MAPSNETVDRLNQAAQWRRIRAGELGAGEWLEYPNWLQVHVGDEIATRRNDRRIETDRHEMVRNRNILTVTVVNDDWTITAGGATVPETDCCDDRRCSYRREVPREAFLAASALHHIGGEVCACDATRKRVPAQWPTKCVEPFGFRAEGLGGLIASGAVQDEHRDRNTEVRCAEEQPRLLT